MNQRSFALSLVALFIAGASSLARDAVAQTETQTSLSPCAEVTSRPKLKRRQPLPDNKPADDNAPAPAAQERPNCEPASEASPLKDPDRVTVGIKGLHALDELNVWERLKKRGIVFSRTVMPDPATLNDAASILTELLTAQGYLQASVDVVTIQEARAVTFNINQGPRLPIAEIKFSGNRVFTADELAAPLQEHLADIQDPSQSSDGRVNFEYSLHRVTNFMRSRGYLQARLGEPENQITPQGLVITIPVEERALYRFGEISIEGAEAITVEQLRSRFPPGRGDIANGEALGKWLYEDVKKLYGDWGYIEYTAEINPTFKSRRDANEGVVDISINIDEGRRFRLGSIEFRGRNLPEQELRKLFSLNDGDIYSQQLFEAGVRKLNETGWLETVDKDQDSDFKIDEELGQVHIVVKVFPKGDPNYR